MDRNELFVLARQVYQDLIQARLPLDDIDWCIDINPRLRTAMGRCMHIPEGFRIEMNQKLLETGNLDAIKHVLAHEFIHMLPGCFNHGEHFKYWAALLERQNPDYAVTSKFHADQFGLERGIAVNPESQKRYAVECPKCHRRVYRKRMCPVIEHPSNYMCPQCKARLVRVK